MVLLRMWLYTPYSLRNAWLSVSRGGEQECTCLYIRESYTYVDVWPMSSERRPGRFWISPLRIAWRTIWLDEACLKRDQQRKVGRECTDRKNTKTVQWSLVQRNAYIVIMQHTLLGYKQHVVDHPCSIPNSAIFMNIAVLRQGQLYMKTH